MTPAPSIAAPAEDAAYAAMQRDAESFIRDSLRLARQCTAGCADVTAEIAAAGKLGRPGHLAPTGLPLQRHFAVQAMTPVAPVLPLAPIVPAAPARPLAALPAAAQPLPLAPALPAMPAASVVPAKLAPSPAPAIASMPTTAPAVEAPAAAPFVPAPVRIAPTVVAPLYVPETVLVDPAPIPAPRLQRQVEAPEEATAPGPAVVANLPAPAIHMAPMAPAIGNNDGTAIYDISAATVYLPNGERLEAHSGLGYMVDNPRYVDRRNVGSTPPGTYNLQSLSNLFFGVEALRMVPAKGVNTFGRDGFLTHTYLLRGRPAQSNGCVVFPNYAKFLDAYKRGHVKRLVVVASLKQAPVRVAEASLGN